MFKDIQKEKHNFAASSKCFITIFLFKIKKYFPFSHGSIVCPSGMTHKYSMLLKMEPGLKNDAASEKRAGEYAPLIL